MSTTLYAMFDGEVFRPDHPLRIAPNTRVRLTIEAEQAEPRSPRSFLDVAEGLDLDGPPDWSSRLGDYLYGPRSASGE
jgi:hypothetical protein